MGISVKSSGTWRQISSVYVKSSVWRLSSVYVKVSGLWKSMSSPVSGDRGVIAGGWNSSNNFSTMEYITITQPGNGQFFGNLTRGREMFPGTSNGGNNRGVFFGGEVNRESSPVFNSEIEYITISTQSNAQLFGYCTLSGLSSATSNNTNNRGIRSGGWNGSSVLSSMEYITITTPGNASNFGNLTVGRYFLAAASNGTDNRGIFASGNTSPSGPSGTVTTIDYITITTPSNASFFGNLIQRRYHHAGTSNLTGNRGIFGGGLNQFNDILSSIEYVAINNPGNGVNFGNLAGRYGLCATSSGNRGVFAGGYLSNYMDYVSIDNPGNAITFGYTTVNRYISAAASNA